MVKGCKSLFLSPNMGSKYINFRAKGKVIESPPFDLFFCKNKDLQIFSGLKKNKIL